MAAAPKRRLKVFHTTLGFHESVVAAASQRAALGAWGVNQNLFAEGAAEVEQDAAAVKAALASPGQALRRPIGSKGDYKLDPDTPKAPKAKAGAVKANQPKPDRSELNAAEAALKKVQARQEDEAGVLAKRRAELDADEADAEARWKTEGAAAKAAASTARAAYRKAGGR